MKKAVIQLLLITNLTIPGCYLPNQPGPLPRGINDIEYDTKVNVIGVLRNDSIPGQSFVFIISCFDIEKGAFVDTSTIKKANVKLIESGTNREYQFNIDTTLADTLPWAKFVSPPSFLPEANTTYILDITFANGEKILDSTTVPAKPQLSADDIVLEGRTLAIKYTPPRHSAYSQIYISPDVTEDTLFQVSYKDTSEIILETRLKEEFSELHPPIKLEIYAFDENYFKYQRATTNLFLHQYNPTISTIDSAYGCFFSMSDTLLIIDLLRQ